MKKIKKILIGGGITVLIIIIAFYILGLIPSADMEPLHFSIHNRDLVKHSVVVEIFDSSNKSIFYETYELSQMDTLESPIITEKKGIYTFKVTLDDRINDIYEAEVGHGLMGVSIWLDDRRSNPDGPLAIAQAIT